MLCGNECAVDAFGLVVIMHNNHVRFLIAHACFSRFLIQSFSNRHGLYFLLPFWVNR